MRSLVILLSSLAVFSSACFGQRLSFGVKGGLPVTDAFSDHTSLGVDVITHSFSSSKNYVVGPMIELRLPLGLSVEADAFYRPLDLTTDNRVLPQPAIHSSSNLSSWEFPVLGKYHFLHVPVLSPYVEAGPIFRAVGASGSYLSNQGFTLGGGVDIKLLVLRVSPEIRYSRWGKDATVTGFLAAPSNINQAEFLIGVSF
jgi:hypothetical protein